MSSQEEDELTDEEKEELEKELIKKMQLYLQKTRSTKDHDGDVTMKD